METIRHAIAGRPAGTITIVVNVWYVAIDLPELIGAGLVARVAGVGGILGIAVGIDHCNLKSGGWSRFQPLRRRCVAD